MKVCPKCQTRYDVSVRFCPSDSEVLVADASTLVGTTLDGIFRIEKLLGEGAMGAVYRARHVALGDTVAIKVLKLGSGAEDKWLRRFQREGRAARRFRHPNVVAIHDLRVTLDGTAYMVLEFVEGRTLRQELHASGRMRLAKALSILTPLASALDAGHKSGVVHRDLKPDNVMIRWDESGEPVVKLLDLGIAKLLGVDEVGFQPVSTLTLAGQILGTPHYMSPEQWGEIPRDGSAEVDGRADVYSLAVMTFELLAGTWPIHGSDVPSIRAGHLSGSVPSVCEVAPHLPAEVDAIFRRGMAFDRMDRYDTASGFVSALAAVEAEYRESMDQDLVPTRPSLVSSEEPTAILARDSADCDQIEGRDVLTAVWASGDPWPVAINSEPTDASPDDAGDPITQPAPTLPTPGTVDRPTAVRRQWLKFSVWCIAILLLCAFAVWYLRQDNSIAGQTATAVSSPPAPRLADVTCGVDVVAQDGSVRMRAGLPDIRTGESVRLRLRTAESEFVYVVVAGPGDVPTLLLGDAPPPDAGVQLNRTVAGVDFVFPSPDGKLDRIAIGGDERSTPFTILVSKTSLASWGWPAAVAPHELSIDERVSLARLILQAVSQETAGSIGASEMLEARRPEGSESKTMVLKFNISHEMASVH